MKMTRLRDWGLVAAVLLFLSPCGCNRKEANKYEAPPPQPVGVSTAVITSYTPFLEKEGTTEPVNAADVRAQVSGVLQSQKFTALQDITKGTDLYLIEPDQYEAEQKAAQADVENANAAISVAEAAVGVAKAEAERAKLDFDRQQRLLQRDAASKAEFDAAKAANDAAQANLKSAESQVAAARAQLQTAQAALGIADLNVQYTKVKAPINGRISKTSVKEGNLVEVGSLLATIVDESKMFANFTISDRELLRFMRSDRSRGDAEFDLVKFQARDAYLKREGDEGFAFKGKLEYADAKGIDVATGTLAVRAVFDNEDERLLPGLFVTVRIPESQAVEATFVPELSVQRDQRGEYLLLVDDQNIVQRESVNVIKRMNGWARLTESLSPQQKIVVSGLQKAQVGRPVTPVEVTLDLDADALTRGMNENPTDEAEEQLAKEMSEAAESNDDGAADGQE